MGKSPPEQRVLLRNVSWETYERLLEDHLERRTPRFYYDRGVLEIVSPSTEHESLGYLIGVLVDVLAEEMELDVFGTAHTTFKRADLAGGFEPDQSSYFSENAQRVRGKKRIELDLGDPPPDLVVEVDITSFSTNKLPIYARLGVPEVWHHDGERLAILGPGVAGEGYVEIPESTFLRPATGEALTRFVAEGLASRRPVWVRKVREWARARGTRAEP